MIIELFKKTSANICCITYENISEAEVEIIKAEIGIIDMKLLNGKKSH